MTPSARQLRELREAAGPIQSLEDLLERIASRAGDPMPGGTLFGKDVRDCLAAGVGADALDYGRHDGSDAALIRHVATRLRQIGQTSLSLGRIVEGHMNALRLIGLYADREQKDTWLGAARSGSIFGVWGADADSPVTIRKTEDGTWLLSGGKRFASGLGLVGHAVITARDARDNIQLAVIDATDASRQNLSSWKTSGMQATASGDFTCQDMKLSRADLIGGPGDYLREPFFEGGVWRYAAVQLGGLEALTDIARRHIVERDLTENREMSRRLADLVMACETGRLWVEEAARRTECGSPVTTSVAYALLARETVERCCVEGLAIFDRMIGAASFFEGHPAEPIRRDLSFFLRQANLDGKLHAAARVFARNAIDDDRRIR